MPGPFVSIICRTGKGTVPMRGQSPWQFPYSSGTKSTTSSADSARPSMPSATITARISEAPLMIGTGWRMIWECTISGEMPSDSVSFEAPRAVQKCQATPSSTAYGFEFSPTTRPRQRLRPVSTGASP